MTEVEKALFVLIKEGYDVMALSPEGDKYMNIKETLYLNDEEVENL